MLPFPVIILPLQIYFFYVASHFAAAFMNVPASGSTAEQRAPPVCMNLVLATRAGRSHSGNTERSKFIHPDQL